MNEELQEETHRLELSWARHAPNMLREYLVAGVEDPRINLQSLLSRHFLIRLVSGGRHETLMHAEYRFAAAMNQVLRLGENLGEAGDVAEVVHALERGADQWEGGMLSRFLCRLWKELSSNEPPHGNYVKVALETMDFSQGRARLSDQVLGTYQDLWHARMQAEPPKQAWRLRVLEPACGSANDYRSLKAFGIAGLIDYTGFDLCAANIANARSLFPDVRFEVGNVFSIPVEDGAFDVCFLHDLFEHLSGMGIEQAVGELCRVTRQAIHAGCFNVGDLAQHHIEPYEQYHWNTLSPGHLERAFSHHGFSTRTIHIGTFLRDTLGCERTHNPNATSFELWRRASGSMRVENSTLV